MGKPAITAIAAHKADTGIIKLQPTGVSAMQTQSLAQIVEQIFLTHRINRADQALLMSALLDKEAISAEEKRLVDRVFDGLSRGILRVA